MPKHPTSRFLFLAPPEPKTVADIPLTSPYDHESDNILDPLLDPSVTNTYCDADGCPEPIGADRYEMDLGGELQIFCSPYCRRRTYLEYYAVEGDEGPV